MTEENIWGIIGAMWLLAESGLLDQAIEYFDCAIKLETKLGDGIPLFNGHYSVRDELTAFEKVHVTKEWA
jgi:hypothetical protein